MTENSGFLNEESDFAQISAAFSEVEILGSSASNFYGRTNRFGKRWFFKGVAPSTPDAAAARQRLRKEFDIQARLDHPGVARIISLENIAGVGHCIIAEWIEGETLADAINGNSLSSADRLRIFSEIVDAVGYLHSQGIVHRDLKPANIMIRKNGQSAVIVDFGLADTDTHLYQKSPAGTEGYASQRQHVAHTPYTGDDIHALGVIMQQLCPALSTIARHSKEGRYPTADALRRAISRRSRHRKIISWTSASAIFLIIIASLILHITSLQNKTAALQSHIEAMTDSVTSLRSTARTINTALRDSLSTINNQLDTEKAIRLDRERRQTQLNELKATLNQRLDKVFNDFRKSESPVDPENHSLLKLIDRLTTAKTDFLAREIPFALSDQESSELEHSFILHYNAIIQQWNQTLSQYRQNTSAE